MSPETSSSVRALLLLVSRALATGGLTHRRGSINARKRRVLAAATPIRIAALTFCVALAPPAMMRGDEADTSEHQVVSSRRSAAERSEALHDGYEFGAGYLFFSDGDLDFPIGWNAHFAKNVGRSFGFVGELSQSFTSGSDPDLSILTIASGFRASLRGEGPMVPYADALAGLARLNPGGTEPTLIAGAGVDWIVTPRLSVRTGAEYQAIFAGGGTESTVRLQVGLVYRMGRSSAPRDLPEEPFPPRAGTVVIEATPTERSPRVPSSPTPVAEPPESENPSPASIVPTPPEETPSAPSPITIPPPTETPPPVDAPSAPAQIPVAPSQEPPDAMQASPPAPSQDAVGSPGSETAVESVSTFDRGRELLLAGDYPSAAAAFSDHLGRERRFTIAIGLFCEPSNLGERVESTDRNAPLWIGSVSVEGRSCFGVYWGLYDSSEQAEEALRILPEAIRSSQPIVMSTESLRP